MDLREMQTFIRVDISHPRDHLLVQQCVFDHPRFFSQRRDRVGDRCFPRVRSPGFLKRLGDETQTGRIAARRDTRD